MFRLRSARPKATLVALDLFAESYDEHFRRGERPEDRLSANLRAAGVEQRTTIQRADMRELPFETASFDAVVSSYAVDHLGRDGIKETLAETARVLKPGGDFLLMVVHKDGWMKLTFGPLVFHTGTRPAGWWADQLRQAGFEIREQGEPPATLYLLARKSN